LEKNKAELLNFKVLDKKSTIYQRSTNYSYVQCTYLQKNSFLLNILNFFA